MVYHEDVVYTVKQLANLAGISTRTLRYYDQIGLLNPDSIRSNGYREYGEQSVLKLQQILFYRELGLGLDEIRRIMIRPDFDATAALESHRKSLQGRAERLKGLIRTVDDTILHLKGQKNMSNKQLFEAFSEEQQKEYARQAEQMYDPEIVRASNRKWKAYTADQRKRIMDEGNRVYVDMVAAMPKGAASTEVQAIVERWRRHIEYFWTPNLGQLLGLAEGYNTHPEFAANFAKIHPSLASFMRDAVKIYVESAQGQSKRQRVKKSK
jgi:DNA-binding transcriptional MerR regulator